MNTDTRKMYNLFQHALDSNILDSIDLSSEESKSMLNEWYVKLQGEYGVFDVWRSSALKRGLINFGKNKVDQKTNSAIFFIVDDGMHIAHVLDNKVNFFWTMSKELELYWDLNNQNHYANDYITKNCSQITMDVIGALAFISELKETEYIEVTERKVKSYKNNKKGVKNKKPVFIRSKKYLILKGETNNRKEFQRYTESWTVRGHWRKLSSGAFTWVRPHIKGKGEFTAKDYKLTDVD
jgi:hypothetical protein